MQGPLHEIGLLDVLQLLQRGKRSGELRLIGPDAAQPRTLRIRDGRVVALSPDADDTSLRATLLSRCLAGPVGGGPTRSRVEALRRELASRALEEMAAWDRGEFDFNESLQQPGALDFTAEMVSRGMVEREEATAELAARLEQFQLIPDFPDRTSEGLLSQLDALSWQVLDAVDGIRSVAAIAARLDQPLVEVARRIERLLAETILVRRSAAAEVDLTARAAVAAGRYDEAIDQLQSRVASVATDQEAWRLLGLAQIGAGRFDQAVAAWRNWRSLAGPDAVEADALILAARTMLEAMRNHRD